MSAALFSPRGLWRALTAADRAACAVVLAVAFALAAFARAPEHGATRARVTVGRDEVADLALDAPGVTRIAGRLGPVTLEVADGAIRVVESGCPHHVCIAMGAKDRSGEILACVPNALLVRLEGGAVDPAVPDAVSR